MLNLESVASFVGIADAGSLSQAGRLLGVSRSVISARLAELERALGAKLIRRTTRVAALTQDGSLEGDANGAPHLEPAAYAKRFSGKYSHRTLSGGIGHNLPQEAPKVFAQAVIDVVKL